MKTVEQKQEWISRAEAGRRLGVSGMMVTKYIKRGAPTRNDKNVPWPDLQVWVRRNIVPQMSGSYQARLREGGVSSRRHQSALDLLHRVSAPDRMTDFARVCVQRFGLTRKQALWVTNWLVFDVLRAVDGDFAEPAPEPTPEEWRAVLGNLDVAAALDEYELRSDPEIRRVREAVQ